ncbi:hypothetical protein BCR39DRAFT_524310 [Naematelia encephala]|uniref:Ketoreductase (KR) domain-containing protein n=1 Tax=Naematelia encephala TaxID=71784 RepID=A0A1Y2BBP7_9TREE|nr:hypothetical protein BCR39DRAFT_524310 [Naematelia encephala]
MSGIANQGLEKVSLQGKGFTIAIVGGTTGIGAAIARCFAKLGAERILIVGRNEERAAERIAEMDKLAPAGLKTNYEFVKGDISDLKGMKAAAASLEKIAGTSGITHFIMCQNGIPATEIQTNADGDENGFAVQALSRFTLAYLLLEHNVIAPGGVVLAVANPGLSLDTLSVDDLSLKKVAEAGRSKLLLFLDCSKRDSTVLDSVFEELSKRYPKQRFFHCHPGVVATELFNTGAFPFPMNLAVSLALWTIAPKPDDYAVVPVYLAVGSDIEEKYGSEKFFTSKLKPSPLGTWASNAENRQKLWKKLEARVLDS